MTTWDGPTRTVRERPQREKRAQQPTTFKGGDFVWHKKYGEGVVVSSQFVSGDMEQVDVLFPGDVGQKTIIADYLKKMDV